MSAADLIDKLCQEVNPDRWDLDWNSPRIVLRSDGSGKFVARGETVSIAEFIVAASVLLPHMAELVRALEAIAREYHAISGAANMARDALASVEQAAQQLERQAG